jgi:hypothetical protein
MKDDIKTYAKNAIKHCDLLIKAKKETKKLKETFIKLYPYAPKEDVRAFNLIEEIITEIDRDHLFQIETIKQLLED